MRRTMLLLSLALVVAACQGPSVLPRFDVQGHRGARALWPENTIPGFLGALDLGVTTLELDVVVSADHRVVVSHEPWFHAAFSTAPDGRAVREEDARRHAIYRMTYDEVRAYDVGRRGHAGYPRQRAMPVVKPTLDDVFKLCDLHAQRRGRIPPRYNVEIKSRAEWDGELTPPVAEFAQLVLLSIERAGVGSRTNVQSFDRRALRAVRLLAPELDLALLIGGDEPRDVAADVEQLGFTPEIYSPHHKLVDRAMVLACRDLGMRIIPWTVNDRARMNELDRLGVDGVITDTPDLAIGLVR